jgi:hypothetical protein
VAALAYRYISPWEPSEVDNTIAALEHNDPICELGLFYIPGPQVMEKSWQRCSGHSQQSHVCGLGSLIEVRWSFPGGSAPNLQTLNLDLSVSFPGLPNLLLSATHLHLYLCKVALPGNPQTRIHSPFSPSYWRATHSEHRARS